MRSLDIERINPRRIVDWPGDMVSKTWYELAHLRDYARRRDGRRSFALSPHALNRRVDRMRPRSDWVQPHRGRFWGWTHAPAAAAPHWRKRNGYTEIGF